MNAEKISIALGHIDDDIVETVDALRSKKRPGNLKLWITLAACLCFVIAISIMIPLLQRSPGENTDGGNRFPTGGGAGAEASITKAFIIEGTIWFFRDERDSSGTGTLFTVDSEGNETKRHTFPTYIYPEYCKSRGLFYYVDGDTLCSYNPHGDVVTNVCATGDMSYFVQAVTDNYVIITNYVQGDFPAFKHNTVVNLNTNEAHIASGLGIGTVSILGTYGDKIIVWEDQVFLRENQEDYYRSINLYDCATDSFVELHKKEPTFTDGIGKGCIFGGSFYFIEGALNGVLKVIEGFDSGAATIPAQVEEVSRNIVDVASADDYLVCAVRERPSGSEPSRISFYYLYPDGRFVHFATWEDARFIVPTSLRMAVADGLLVACITTQDDIFMYELSN
jgi:hypothetical protein